MNLSHRKKRGQRFVQDYNTVDRRCPAQPWVVVMKSIIFVAMMAALLPWQVVTAQTQAATSTTNDPGKVIFISRCGSCHDADASKETS